MNEPLHLSVFPYWVRWVSLAWLAVWVPSYAVYWGWANFLHLCDVGVFLACLGFAYNNALLLSSQAVSSLVGDLLWCLDAGWRWFVGRHLTGGTEYMGTRGFLFACAYSHCSTLSSRCCYSRHCAAQVMTTALCVSSL